MVWQLGLRPISAASPAGVSNRLCCLKQHELRSLSMRTVLLQLHQPWLLAYVLVALPVVLSRVSGGREILGARERLGHPHAEARI